MGKYGNIHSAIPTPEKKSPLIPLGNNLYAIKKNPNYSYSAALRTETSNMH